MKSTYNTTARVTPTIKATTVTDSAGSVLYTVKGFALDDNEKRVKFALYTEDRDEFEGTIETIRNEYDAQIVKIYTASTVEL